jgi:protein involved in polysaccharide export with SLBB domain
MCFFLVVNPSDFLYINKGFNAKKGLSLKRAVLRLGVALSLTGLVLIGSSCRTGVWHRSKPAASQGVIPVVTLPEQAVKEEVTVIKEEPPAPVKPATRPWYKRMWGRGSVKGSSQPVPSVDTPAPAPAEAPVAVKTEEPVVTEAQEVEKPAAKPWYKLWSKKRVKKAPGNEEAERRGSGSVEKTVEAEPPEVPEEAKGKFSSSGEPLIKVGYALRISVSAGGKVEVAEQIKGVSDHGSISMPLVGIVDCEGLTLKELSERLAAAYAQFIRDPLVSVSFVYEGKQGEISPWGAVVVYGLVRQPGMVNIPPTRDLTVSRAIQLAGGADPKANQAKITVFRLQKDGTMKKINVDLVAVAEKGLREKDIKLEPGDGINVPEAVW